MHTQTHMYVHTHAPPQPPGLCQVLSGGMSAALSHMCRLGPGWRGRISKQEKLSWVAVSLPCVKHSTLAGPRWPSLESHPALSGLTGEATHLAYLLYASRLWPRSGAQPSKLTAASASEPPRSLSGAPSHGPGPSNVKARGGRGASQSSLRPQSPARSSSGDAGGMAERTVGQWLLV